MTDFITRMMEHPNAPRIVYGVIGPIGIACSLLSIYIYVTTGNI